MKAAIGQAMRATVRTAYDKASPRSPPSRRSVENAGSTMLFSTVPIKAVGQVQIWNASMYSPTSAADISRPTKT